MDLAFFCGGHPAAEEECAIFILRAEKNKLAVSQRESLTSGAVNVFWARFEFSDDWLLLPQVRGRRLRPLPVPWNSLQKFTLVPPSEEGDGKLWLSMIHLQTF